MPEKKQETGSAVPGGGRGARKSPETSEAGQKKSGGKLSGGGSPAGTARPARKSDLRKDLREFASARPHGWGHEDWINFLESLQSRGHDVRDRDAIGLALERERLDLALSGIKGVTAQKRKALVERFGTTWSLRNAGADEIASAGGVDRSVAERIKSDLT